MLFVCGVSFSLQLYIKRFRRHRKTRHGSRITLRCTWSRYIIWCYRAVLYSDHNVYRISLWHAAVPFRDFYHYLILLLILCKLMLNIWQSCTEYWRAGSVRVESCLKFYSWNGYDVWLSKAAFSWNWYSVLIGWRTFCMHSNSTLPGIFNWKGDWKQCDEICVDINIWTLFFVFVFLL